MNQTLRPEADAAPVARPIFRVREVRRIRDGVEERLGLLEDGRRIRAVMAGGVLDIEVANPMVDSQKKRRLYSQHRGKMRTILVKAVAPDDYGKNSISYRALKAHTAGFIIWPEKEINEN